LTHAYQIKGNDVDFLFLIAEPTDGARLFYGTGIAVGYLMFAVTFVAFGIYCRRNPQLTELKH